MLVKLLFYTIPRFSEQSSAENVAAVESAQLSMGSLQSAPFDNNMDLFICDRTWLETAKENVCSYLSKIGLVAIHSWI